MSTGAAPTPAVPEAALSQAERVIDTFIAPSKTFTDIKRSASWWVPWVLMAVAALAFVFTVQNKVGFQQLWQNEMRFTPKQMERIEKLPPEQQESARSRAAMVTAIRAYGTPAWTLLWSVIVAAVLLATFRFGAGAGLSFSTSLAVVIYSSLPAIIKSLLGILALLAGADPAGFVMQNPIGSNLGYFLDPTHSIALYALGSAVDVFMIWTLALAGIGFACVSKLKRTTTMGVVFGWYILLTLVGAGIGSLFA